MKRLNDYSQNFLRRPSLVMDLFNRTKFNLETVILDIGAGSGVISSTIAPHVKQVIAVEFEPRMAEKLRENTAKHPNITVEQDDILTMPLPTKPYSVFANIPFHLSSPIVERLISEENKPESIYLIVQKQFGRKLIAETDKEHFTSQLGMLVGIYYKVRIFKALDRTDFWPHPAVDTVCMEFIAREEPLIIPKRFRAYRQFTKDCFSNPKNLKGMPLAQAGLSEPLSPSRLTIGEWVGLFNLQTRY